MDGLGEREGEIPNQILPRGQEGELILATLLFTPFARKRIRKSQAD